MAITDAANWWIVVCRNACPSLWHPSILNPVLFRDGSCAKPNNTYPHPQYVDPLFTLWQVNPLWRPPHKSLDITVGSYNTIYKYYNNINDSGAGHVLVVDGANWMWRPKSIPREFVSTASRGVESTSRQVGIGRSKL